MPPALAKLYPSVEGTVQASREHPDTVYSVAPVVQATATGSPVYPELVSHARPDTAKLESAVFEPVSPVNTYPAVVGVTHSVAEHPVTRYSVPGKAVRDIVHADAVNFVV
jgi:hypothetical protein